MGIHVEIFQVKEHYDCTNGGATSQNEIKGFTIKEIEGPFEPCEEYPEAVIVRRDLPDGEYLHVEPVQQYCRNRPIESKRHCMFGGSFVSTSDSRFSKVSRYALRVHDRIE